RQFETVPTPNVPGGGYPDRLGRDETRCRPESGSARFKPFCFQFLADTGNRAWRNGRECPVRNHTSGRESIGDDECEHSLRRRCDHANEAEALQNSRCGPAVLACSRGSVCHGRGRRPTPLSAGPPRPAPTPPPPFFSAAAPPPPPPA